MARSKQYSAEELLERRRTRGRARKKDLAVKARMYERAFCLRGHLARIPDCRRDTPPVMAEPVRSGCSAAVQSCSRETQASIASAHTGMQCTLGFLSSVGCQTEAAFPGAGAAAEQHGRKRSCSSSDAGKCARNHQKAQVDGNRHARQSCEQHAYHKTTVTFPKTVHDKAFTCSICKEVFGDRGRLYSHMMAHSGEKPFRCPLCPKSFCRRENLTAHERSHADAKRFVCGTCQAGFPTRVQLMVHEQSHAVTKPTIVCGVCQQEFAQEACLAVHERLHTGDKCYSCPHCSESFTRKDKFFVPERSHSGEKPFLCSTCRKSFAAKRDLVIHKRSHTGERPYVCNVCREGFSSKKRLDSHRRLHSAGARFVCTPCGLSFTSTDCLLRHIKSVTHQLEVNIDMTKLNATRSSV
ncbi:uncharacterized protein LOC144142353 isoform X1 [Haemaphysalis longicornis]